MPDSDTPQESDGSLRILELRSLRHRGRPMDSDAKLVRACRILEEHRDRPVPLADLAAEVGWSPHHLQRTFKAAIGYRAHVKSADP